MSTPFRSFSLEEMQSLARKLAVRVAPGDIITLSGELGSGKTAFARALIDAIAISKQEVTSPTFNIMQSYDVKSADGLACTLWHLDLYRLKNAAEADALGLSELWQQIVLIEWPEVIRHLLPAKRLDISFDFGENHATRKLVLVGDTTWQNRIREL